MTHSDVWTAIDNMAAALHMSASGLARCGGMDSTTFNKSKRLTAFGKPRWPTMQSISKILNANNMSIDDFMQFFPHNYDKKQK